MSPAFTAVPRVLRDYARDEHQRTKKPLQSDLSFLFKLLNGRINRSWIAQWSSLAGKTGGSLHFNSLNLAYLPLYIASRYTPINSTNHEVFFIVRFPHHKCFYTHLRPTFAVYSVRFLTQCFCTLFLVFVVMWMTRRKLAGSNVLFVIIIIHAYNKILWWD